MTAAAELTFAEAMRIVRDEAPVRDKSYRRFPIGQEVGRFLRAKRVERGILPATIQSYEPVLAKLALRHPDFESLEPFTEVGRGPELLLDFLFEFWGECDPDTMRQRRAILASFFEWAYRHDRISADPMRKIERSRRASTGAKRERVPGPLIGQLVSAQTSEKVGLRDQCAILLMGRLAFRREDVRMLQLRDIDLARDEIRLLHAKGGAQHVLPITFPDLRQALTLHLAERAGAPEEFLVYPRAHRRRPLTQGGIDYWFRQCIKRAEIAHYTMHQLRHAAIDDLKRGTGDVELAQHLARHASVKTTQAYLHTNVDDLRAAIAAMEGGEGTV